MTKVGRAAFARPGKQPPRNDNNFPKWCATLVFLMFLLIEPEEGIANPEGGVVAAGGASITNSGNTTTINQSTDKAVVNWNITLNGNGNYISESFGSLLMDIFGIEPEIPTYTLEERDDSRNTASGQSVCSAW